MTTFHPGHDALHGFTVVVWTSSGDTFIGRWDATEGASVWMNDVCDHRPGPECGTTDEFLASVAVRGPQVRHRRLAVPTASITDVRPLGDVLRELRGER